MSTLDEIKQMCLQYPDGRVLFNDPLKIKASPHVAVFTAYGAWTGDNGIFLMDAEGNWHGPLLESDVNGKLVISSVFQRLRILTNDVRKAV